MLSSLTSLDVTKHPTSWLLPIMPADCGEIGFDLTEHTSKSYTTLPVDIDGMPTTVCVSGVLEKPDPRSENQNLSTRVTNVIIRQEYTGRNGKPYLLQHTETGSYLVQLRADGFPAGRLKKVTPNQTYGQILERTWEALVEARDARTLVPPGSPHTGRERPRGLDT